LNITSKFANIYACLIRTACVAELWCEIYVTHACASTIRKATISKWAYKI